MASSSSPRSPATTLPQRALVADVEIVSCRAVAQFTVRLHFPADTRRQPEDVCRTWDEWVELDRLLADGAEATDLVPRLPRRSALFVTKAVLAARGEDLERWLRLLVRDPIIGRLPFLHAWMACSGRPQLKRAPSLPAKRSAQSLRMTPSASSYQLSAPAASASSYFPFDDRTVRPSLPHRARRSPLYALDSVNEHGVVHPPSPTSTITPTSHAPMQLAPAANIGRPGAGGLRSFMSMQDLRQVVRPAPSVPLPSVPVPEEPSQPVSPASSGATATTMRAQQHEFRRRSASSASSSVVSLARSSLSTATSESEGNSSAGSLSPSIPLTPPTTTTAGRFRVDEATGVVVCDDHIPHYVFCPLPSSLGAPPSPAAPAKPFAGAPHLRAAKATPPPSPNPCASMPGSPSTVSGSGGNGQLLLKIVHAATGEICVMRVGGAGQQRESVGQLRERARAKLGVATVHQLELANGEGTIATWDDLSRAAAALVGTGVGKIQLVAH